MLTTGNAGIWKMLILSFGKWKKIMQNLYNDICPQ